MLMRWSIENFKSFLGRTDIDLAPISVFAGANSSGKSTIIQSILLLKQTIQYAPTTRPLALNGPLLKLGTFNDVKNVTSDESFIGLSWIIDVEERQHAVYPAQPYAPWGSQFYYGEQSVKSVSGKFRWDVAPPIGPDTANQMDSGAGRELLQFQPRLVFSIVEAELKKEDSETTHLGISRSSDVRVINYPFKVDIDRQSEDELLSPKPEGRIIGASSTYFFPGQLVIEYNAVRERARRIASVLVGSEPLYSWAARDLQNVNISAEVIRHIQGSLRQGQADQPSSELFPQLPEMPMAMPIAQVVRTLQHLLRRAQRTEATDLVTLRAQLEHMLSRDEPARNAIDLASPQATNEAVQFCAQYFQSSVRYLGPLRDEPKPVYPLEALANPTEVGYRGEHTAAVLDLQRETRIQYIPSSFVSNPQFPRTEQPATLHDAVVDWLSYVGVANEFVTSDYGKFGHQLTVQTEGLNRFHDLTNVGVGVSQVLPIIVMALLAEKPSLLIFEQPELHLHPKVQARLADFFFSVSLCGKQCLIETHSEYLIERFRRRVAEAEGDSLRRLLKIYFVERVAGKTRCRPVEVTEYGAIPEWPQDFFDQSQEETEHILQAATQKRAANRAK